jgi:hypothetical protein
MRSVLVEFPVDREGHMVPISSLRRNSHDVSVPNHRATVLEGP